MAYPKVSGAVHRLERHTSSDRTVADHRNAIVSSLFFVFGEKQQKQEFESERESKRKDCEYIPSSLTLR